MELELETADGRHCLTIRVADSGAGFDVRQLDSRLETNQSFGGRGIPLLRSLCERLTYSAGGTLAEAVVSWTAPAVAPAGAC